MFRRKPAITNLDWHFTCFPKLIGEFCNIHPFDLL